MGSKRFAGAEVTLSCRKEFRGAPSPFRFPITMKFGSEPSSLSSGNPGLIDLNLNRPAGWADSHRFPTTNLTHKTNRTIRFLIYGQRLLGGIKNPARHRPQNRLPVGGNFSGLGRQSDPHRQNARQPDQSKVYPRPPITHSFIPSPDYSIFYSP